MNKNIVLCGVGGQGTVLASKLIATAAMEKGLSVLCAETIGMAQRGGSVFSHVRIGNKLYSPLIAEGTADIILGFEPGETVRMLPYLKRDGQIVVSSHAVMPVTASLAASGYNAKDMLHYLHSQTEGLIVVDTDKAIEEIGTPKALNVLMLGAAVKSGALGLSSEDIRNAIKKRLPGKLHALNFKALEYGQQ